MTVSLDKIYPAGTRVRYASWPAGPDVPVGTVTYVVNFYGSPVLEIAWSSGWGVSGREPAVTTEHPSSVEPWATVDTVLDRSFRETLIRDLRCNRFYALQSVLRWPGVLKPSH